MVESDFHLFAFGGECHLECLLRPFFTKTILFQISKLINDTSWTIIQFSKTASTTSVHSHCNYPSPGKLMETSDLTATRAASTRSHNHNLHPNQLPQSRCHCTGSVLRQMAWMTLRGYDAWKKAKLMINFAPYFLLTIHFDYFIA